MTKLTPACVAATLLLAASIPAWSQTQSSGPSVYLQCDGNPPHRSVGELLGRALLLTATLGVAGMGEVQDVSKRAHGIEGVEACDAALLQESDPIRKVQLKLARSVHDVEAKDYAAALQDAREAPSLAGLVADDIAFRHSLLVSSLELQAAAQARAGNFPEAAAAAIRMADASPYDVIAQVRALPYVQTVAELTPEKQAYLDRLVKIFPEALGFRANAYVWAGKYLEAAQDYADILDLSGGFSPDGNAPPLPSVLAMRSAMLALGGQMDQSQSVAADATAMIRVLTASGKAGLMQAAMDSAEQALDFQAIIVDLEAGRASAAREKFIARSRWSVPSAPAVAELAARLRQGAPSSELVGLLAADPATIRADGLIANAGAITEADNADAALYGDIRPPLPAGTYVGWTDDVRDVKSFYLLHQKAVNENYVGEFLLVPRVPGFFKPPHVITIAAGDALLMHAALLAEARGTKGFELAPGRKQLDAFFVRFGNPGDPGMPAATTFDAATVATDLSDEFPESHPKSAPASQ